LAQDIAKGRWINASTAHLKTEQAAKTPTLAQAARHPAVFVQLDSMLRINIFLHRHSELRSPNTDPSLPRHNEGINPVIRRAHIDSKPKRRARRTVKLGQVKVANPIACLR